MTLVNEKTGHVLTMEPPNQFGYARVMLNGRQIEGAVFSDDNGGTVTLSDGRTFKAGIEFAQYVISLLKREGAPVE